MKASFMVSTYLYIYYRYYPEYNFKKERSHSTSEIKQGWSHGSFVWSSALQSSYPKRTQACNSLQKFLYYILFQYKHSWFTQSLRLQYLLSASYLFFYLKDFIKRRSFMIALYTKQVFLIVITAGKKEHGPPSFVEIVRTITHVVQSGAFHV